MREWVIENMLAEDEELIDINMMQNNCSTMQADAWIIFMLNKKK
jgi:hypothetical protein